MKSTKASLTETIQYLCRGKVLASETRELASVSRGKIRPGEGEEWLNEQMYVPPLPPTNLRGCHLINVLYHVYVSKIYFISYRVWRAIARIVAEVALEFLKLISRDFPAVRHKPEEPGQGNQATNTDRAGHVPPEAGGCTSWYGAVQAGRPLPVDATHLPTLARRQGLRNTRVKARHYASIIGLLRN